MASHCRRASSLLVNVSRRRYATATPQVDAEAISHTISETNPLKLNESHVGRVMVIPSDIFNGPKNIHNPENDAHHFAPRHHVQFCDTIGKHFVLVRKPFVEILDYIKLHSSVTREDSLRIALYGKHGNGKSLTLASLFYYLIHSNVVTVNFGDLRRWMIKYGPISKSVHCPSRYDHVKDANDLLRNFAAVNKKKIKHLTVSRDYAWSVRDVTKAGSPLIDIVKIGIERAQFSSDCFNALLKELDIAAKQGDCRLAILVDGINLLYRDISRVDPDQNRFVKAKEVWRPDVNYVRVEDLSVMRNLRNVIKNSTPNTMLFSTVDHLLDFKFQPTRYWEFKRKSHVNYQPEFVGDLPFTCLGQRGWEALHPFIPVAVPPFNHSELDSLISFLHDVGYLSETATTDDGREEIHFLTGGNGNDFRLWSSAW